MNEELHVSVYVSSKIGLCALNNFSYSGEFNLCDLADVTEPATRPTKLQHHKPMEPLHPSKLQALSLSLCTLEIIYPSSERILPSNSQVTTQAKKNLFKSELAALKIPQKLHITL